MNLNFFKFLILALFFSFQISYSQTEDLIEKTESSNEAVTLVVVDKVPVYTGCENLTSNAEKKNCMQKKLYKHIARKFAPFVVEPTCVETKIVEDKEVCVKSEYWPSFSSGRVRIITKFKINEEGHVTDIEARAPHERLKKEAERVIKSIPKMVPAMFKGEKVSIAYTLPINLKLGD